MSHFITLGGKRVFKGTLTIPTWGTWSGDFELADPEKVSGATEFVMGDLTMKCFSRTARAAAYGGKAAARVVGGAGGWNKVIAKKGYSHAAGVKLKTLLDDAAQAAGERITVANDKTIGKVWARKKMRASSVLRILLDGQWWVDVDGVAQTKARPSTSIASAFQVLDHKPSIGLTIIAAETYKDWTPGRKFNAPTLPSEQTISSVSFDIADGKITIRVLNCETPQERLLSEIRAIIRDEVMRLEYGSIVEYVVTKADDEQVINCKPAAGKDSPWPELADVKLKPGLMGETVKATVGAKALIVFMDDDPSLYRCIGLEGPTAKTSMETSGDFEVQVGGVYKVNGGSNFVALANLVNQNFTTLVTKFNSHTHGSGVGPTTPPIVPLVGASDFPSVACTKFKTA